MEEIIDLINLQVWLKMLLLLSRVSHVRLSTDSSPAGSSVPGIFQARTLEWVAIAKKVVSWQIDESIFAGLES